VHFAKKMVILTSALGSVADPMGTPFEGRYSKIPGEKKNDFLLSWECEPPGGHGRRNKCLCGIQNLVIKNENFLVQHGNRHLQANIYASKRMC